MAVPKTMQAKYDEIADILRPYCDEYLNDEYKEEFLDLIRNI